jgi:thioredoxin reductase (NADPH)
MKAQAEHVGTEIIGDIVEKADLSSRPFTLTLSSGEVFKADTVIVATGAQAKWLGLPTEEEFKGYGVSACATCDGFFYRNKRVFVIGGGNTAVEEVLFLTNFASEVVVIHRRDSFKAEKILQERLFKHPKVKIWWHTALEEVRGSSEPKKVTSALVKNVLTGDIREELVDGIFVAIGHSPAVELFVGQLTQKPSGVLWTEPYSTKTNIEGVYAAGDVADDVFRQAVTSAGMGCMAALEAEKFLAGH